MSRARGWRALRRRPGRGALRLRPLDLLAALAGLLLAAVIVSVPLSAWQQSCFALAGIATLLLLRRVPGRRVTMFLAVISCIVSVRYLVWRLTETLEFETPLQLLLGSGLLLAETYAVLTLALGYLQTVHPLERKPVPLPADPDSWPEIDVYIPTYNEAIEVVRPTVLAAMAMDWPRHKLKVYILDDGRRPEFRAFAAAAGAGYVVRPDNKGAKAGNINHALKLTRGEYVVIFDCDHIPTRAFLQMTLGWMVRDPKICMLQTPHHFYSPDPFERNLANGRKVPNEGLLFYGRVQQGNDLWNASFFCGSCAVIRRIALEQVGGVPTETVTEDAHCALRMQRLGWRTAYLRLPLAAGLATERLMLHIGQRMRWARGMIQILRIENPLLASGLTLWQRLCYFMAASSFLFSLPRLIFLTSPLAYLLLGVNIIAASPLAIIAYAGPHMVHSIATNSRITGNTRHSFWSEIYETSLAVHLLPVTIMTLLSPRKGKFNVTAKGGTIANGYLDFRAVVPNLIMAALLGLGLGVGIHGILTSGADTLRFQAYLLNSIWAALCLVPLLASIAVGRERPQLRENARVPAILPARLHLEDGREVAAVTSDLSLGGGALTAPRPTGLRDGDQLRISFVLPTEQVTVPAKVVKWEGEAVHLIFTPASLADDAAIVRTVFGRADAWLEWDAFPLDRPLRALRAVVASTFNVFSGGLRFDLRRHAPSGKPAQTEPKDRMSDILPPRSERLPPAAGKAAALLLCLLLPAAAVAQPQPQPLAQSLVQPLAQPLAPAAEPPAAAPDPSRRVTLRLGQLGLRGPMQLRGLSDLQGLLFGLRAEEVVSEARLVVIGGASPALLPGQSEVSITLNEQVVGSIRPNPAQASFGPLEFPINPVFFTDSNRLNFRFAGRYTTECNDPLSGLLWANISDLSTLQLTIERLPPVRDLARLPQPLFDARIVHEPLTLPVVLPAEPGSPLLRAAAVTASWFAQLADYRGARFPVRNTLPERGDAVLLLAGAGTEPVGLAMPRIDGPTLALLANPNDAMGTLLVVAGRNGAEAATAALALAAGRSTLAGPIAQVEAPRLPARQPYDAPRWIPTDRPVRFGELVSASELQASGYAPGPVRIPFRTAPDLVTFRNRPLGIDIGFRNPPAPVIDLAAARLDVSIGDTYLRSFRLADEAGWSPWRWLMAQASADAGRAGGHLGLPPYLVFGQNELQLRFDMRPLSRGECAATPGDIRASIDPESSIDLSRAHRFARLPNLAHFASAGFPYTRLADLSDTGFVLPDRPNPVEISAFLNLVGQLAAQVGLPATGLAVASTSQMQQVATRELIAIGALGQLGPLRPLLRDAPVRLEGERLTVSVPDALQTLGALVLGGPSRSERASASALLAHAHEGMGTLMGFESPLQAGKSLLVVTGATPAAVEAMVAALRDPAQLPRIQGDLAVLNGEQVSSFRTGPTYDAGRLPFWLWPQRWFGNSPFWLLALLVASGLLLGLTAHAALRRRAILRLRGKI
ncbi:UDP-forming cellulose synthase catalytic subunit [Roseicella frigidaeris]|uniref:UDP-forming cellulose synthase catalytic subunit n=1 Tax=Roseicella frigidaeris TaxID=2230885 RepID=UPI000FDF6205|nr:UDP-forming cellulose synthase catalytic subunit [Roseicella frigidaeris]